MSAEEEWRMVEGMPCYEVSSLGRIRSWKPKGGFGRPLSSPKMLSPKMGRSGYAEIGLRVGEAKRFFLVHRLVLSAFVGPCPDGMQCAHADGNRCNNAVSNLSWKSPRENNADKRRHGTHLAGEHHPMAKLSSQDIARIRYSSASSSQLANEYSVSASMIRRIRARKNWRDVA